MSDERVKRASFSKRFRDKRGHFLNRIRSGQKPNIGKQNHKSDPTPCQQNGHAFGFLKSDRKKKKVGGLSKGICWVCGLRARVAS